MNYCKHRFEVICYGQLLRNKKYTSLENESMNGQSFKWIFTLTIDVWTLPPPAFIRKKKNVSSLPTQRNFFFFQHSNTELTNSSPKYDSFFPCFLWKFPALNYIVGKTRSNTIGTLFFPPFGKNKIRMRIIIPTTVEVHVSLRIVVLKITTWRATNKLFDSGTRYLYGCKKETNGFTVPVFVKFSTSVISINSARNASGYWISRMSPERMKVRFKFD